MQQFFGGGGWLFYLVTMTLVAGFLAASAIDLELFIIPLDLCWFVTLVGFLGSGVAGFVLNPKTVALFPDVSGSPKTASMALGGHWPDFVPYCPVDRPYQAQL